jgi:hypothetical protein
MLGFFTKIVPMQTQTNKRIYTVGGDVFDLNKTVMADFTATFYRMYIYPRLFGEDINLTINEVKMFASQNDLLYINGDLWLLIEKEF